MRSRDYSIDILRGIAVFGMILAHAIDFYHDGTNDFLHYLVIILNTVTFTTFLFLSGATSFIAYIRNHESPKTLYHHIKKRLGVLLIAYYCLAFISYADKILYGNIVDQIKNVLNILIFRSVPSYAEFFIPFFFFSLIIIPFHRPLYRLSKNPLKALAVGLAIYCLGSYLYKFNIPHFFEPWAALLFGHGSIYRFPVMQYAPIFISGLLWGNYLVENPESRTRQLTSRLTVLYTSCALLVICLPTLTFHMSLADLFKRWPPTIPFLLVGIIYLFTWLNLIFANRQFKKHAFTHDFLLLLGQNALALFWTHIAILKVFKLSGAASISSVFLVLVLFCVLIITSLALSTFIPFNFSFHLTFIRENNGRPFRHYDHNSLPAIYSVSEDISHKTKFHFRLAYSLLAIIIFIFSTSLYPAAREKIFAIKRTPLAQAAWWNDDYSYKQNLVIKNQQPFSNLKSGSKIQLHLNHKNMVAQGQSLENGDDVQIIYYDGQKSYPINRLINDQWNSDQSTISFSLQQDILPKNVTNRYFLYFGNPTANAYHATAVAVSEATPIIAALGDLTKHPNYISINRKWFLKPDAVTQNENLILNLPDDKNNILDPAYEIAGTELRGKLDRSISGDNFYEASIDVSSLVPGRYKIQASFKDNSGKVYTSQYIGFNVSYPLYVAWTWDWEGYDVNESYLAKMTALSKKHDVKLTHFFNPRIYTTSTISQSRIDYLSSWVKNRRDTLGEEVNLHIHMFPDYVSSCGVTPKDSPRWDNYADGYDILTSDYNYDEMLTLVKCGTRLLEEHGFAMPLAYRAGGWYANLETLRAVQDAGIKVDSSGRTKYKFGSRQAPGFWDLAPTTTPYYPSSNDQNSSNPSPRLSLLEIPNNGADSFKFSAKDMIARFDANYQKQYLNQPQQITYLTHPHWFNPAEQQRVDQLFSYIDQFKYQNDNGPVKYVTTGNVYEVFK